ncbi:MAG: hypothetical protein JO112_17955 [Planctomycetes bacterium]|nr:hypothetical protein [Planctomycetota bacterium]
MTQICRKCSRPNPEEASYCYYDGQVLGGPGARGVNGGPVNTGTQPFPTPFVFPTGEVCRNFDELAMACQEKWKPAVELLRQGFLETFLGGLGRADLAMAAREASRFPDQDRGLDQFLAKLPSTVVEPPKLDVAPREVNLGLLKVGEDRQFDLHLNNQGMRLLYGTVRCEEGVWLTVGEGTGAPRKLFQFETETLIPVHVRGQQLRASTKPLEGRLTVDSNGGTETVVVRAEVPVKPYPDGVLAGARSPRQVAEKARTAAREAAVLFEQGAVSQWYKDNGWSYPVQGPAASGLGAVQQFFEALGLTPPPKVEVTPRALTLQGQAGDTLRATLEIKTQEKRPVYAHAASDQGWLEVGRPKLNGRTATISVAVPSVPDRGGETLKAKLTVRANGNQRFVIPVSLQVGDNFNFAAAPLAAEEIPEAVPELLAPPPAAPPPKAPPAPRKAAGAGKTWIHVLPAGCLTLALLALLILDLVKPLSPARDSGQGIDSYWKVALDDPDPRLDVKFSPTMRFGIFMLGEKDPNDPSKLKRLTMAEDGLTNNTCIWLDGKEPLFGQSPGDWANDGKGHSLQKVPLPSPRRGWMSTWNYPIEKVLVRQTVEIIPNEQTHLLDTCLVDYLIENHDTSAHQVGLRVLMDTFIGSNDGVPFAIPGQPGLLTTMKVFDQKDIPDYIEALERPDLKDPGTVAHMGLKLPPIKILPEDPPALAPLESLVICHWPNNSEVRWTWDFRAINEPPGHPDSCVVLYWGSREGKDNPKMEPGERRAMAFTYGLGMISAATGQLGVSAGGNFQKGAVFTVTAYVKNPTEGQKVSIHLPSGLTLEPGQTEEQAVTQAQDYSQVSWRVRAEQVGTFTIEVSSRDASQRYKVQIREGGLFD